MSKHKHILAQIQKATPDEVTRGSLWYANAHLEAMDLIGLSGAGSRPPWTHLQASCIISALSPQNRWERCVEDAWAVARWYASHSVMTCIDRFPSVATYGYGSERARKIAFDAEDPLSHFGAGRKTRDFARLIHRPQLPYVVVIDRHAYRIFRGESPGPTKVSKSDYSAAAYAYIRATDEINEAPERFGLAFELTASQTQAITWLSYKREHNI